MATHLQGTPPTMHMHMEEGRGSGRVIIPANSTQPLGLDVVVHEGVEAGAKFRFAYGGVLCKAKSGPARFPSCRADLGG